MKTLITALTCSLALTAGAFAQSPTMTPDASPQAPSPAASASAAASLSPAAAGSSLADKIHDKIDKKLKHHKGVSFQIGGDEDSADSGKNSDSGKSSDRDQIPEAVLGIVGVVFFTPVLIVAVIMYFGFSKNRMMHRTVRMMVEKGQPVPEALLNPPPAMRQRSDMRRGVVLMMIGIGLIIFLGAVNEWKEGSWAFGMLPFLIGLGYLLVWKLEGKGQRESKADNPPPLP